MRELEKEIAQLDPKFAKQMDKSVLVETKTLQAAPFVHKIQVQGEVASRKNIDMSTETPGRVIQVNVESGDVVKKGQTLIQLDAQSTRNTIDELKTSLELATTKFEKQKNLWDQEIGTEVQYLEVKNRKESLERQLESAQTQLSKAYIRAPFSGIVNEVITKVGEYVSPGIPVLSLVSQEEMYLKADVSEEYINDFKVGDPVEVYLPSTKDTLSTKISALSYVINQANRTFQIEVKLTDKMNSLKPNQFARIDLINYQNPEAIVVNSEVVQEDSEGEFVFTVINKEGVKVANKVRVKPGETYSNETEIISGLKSGDVIISEGYREAINGITVKVTK
ncbi:efflux RND transporter periplasmic adaptor subunit [Marivirga lumbricoides]|uniref:Efflux RND transporter periplasmic adaptor subunit n=1 Tax=Marivirga lumbricoides TaxID=1046115 RepID=A0A2T4DD58_9BACT|nr:efflux RND transporter periplasmic adaptor subunit [Marivirga lumbricoides]